MKITLWRLVLGEGRLGAQVEHQIKALAHHCRLTLEVNRTRRLAHPHALTVRSTGAQVNLVAEVDGTLGAGVDAGVAAGAHLQIDGVGRRPLRLKRPQPAAELPQLPRVRGVLVRLAERAALAVDQQTQVEFVGQQRGGAGAGVGAADDQTAPAGGVADSAHRLWVGGLGGGDQGGEFGRGKGGVARPAACLAQIHKMDRPHAGGRNAWGVVIQLDKQPALLGAGHQQRLGVGTGFQRGLLECAGLTPAQQAQRRGYTVSAGTRGQAQRTRQGWSVQWHRAVAIANQRLHGGGLGAEGRWG